MTAMLFETFSFPSIYIGNQGVLPIFVAGKTTGVCVCSGHAISYTVPVYEGHMLSQGVIKLDFSGKDITESFMKFYGIKDEETGRQIKETYSAISLNTEEETKKVESEEFDLPDGNKITIGDERFSCPESLFHSKLEKFAPEITSTEEEYGGINDAVYTSIKLVDESLAEQLYKNVVLSGGTAMIKGFDERLEYELQCSAPDDSWPNVTPPAESGIYATWIGATLIGGLSSFNKMWIKKEEYEECGPLVVHRRCF